MVLKRNLGFFVLSILIFSTMVEAVYISEVMYNPIGNDNNKEYVEVVLDEPKNMEGWVVEDNSSSDNLELIYGKGRSRMNLIVEEGFNISNLTLKNPHIIDAFSYFNFPSIYSAGASIGNGLNNGGDTIKIYDANSTLVAGVVYNSSFGNGNGKAVCFLKEGRAYECEPSPGIFNKLFRSLFG